VTVSNNASRQRAPRLRKEAGLRSGSAGLPRGRALLIGLPLLAGICCLSVYADMVSKTVQFGVLQLAPPAVFALFALALVSRVLGRLFRRELLSKTDLLLIYVMLLVGVMVSTRGMVEKVIPAARVPAVLRQRDQQPSGTHHTPFACLGHAVHAGGRARLPGHDQALSRKTARGRGDPLVGLGRAARRLVRAARLRRSRVFVAGDAAAPPLGGRGAIDLSAHPLPLAILNDEVEHQPFFRNRLMWLGFGVSAALFTLNGLNVNFPNVPQVSLFLNISPLLTERPWSQMDSVALWISPAVVGFAYFLPTDLLFSLWFFFLLTRVQDVIAASLGGQPMPIETHNARIWTGLSGARRVSGAHRGSGQDRLALLFAGVANGLGTSAGKQALRRPERVDELPGRLCRRRPGLLGIVGWLTLAGMSPWLAVVQMGIYLFVVAVIMTRAVSEAGLLMTETSFLPSHLIRLVQPLPALGPTNLSLLALSDIVFARDLRGVLLSPFMDSQKMAGETGPAPSRAAFAPSAGYRGRLCYRERAVFVSALHAGRPDPVRLPERQRGQHVRPGARGHPGHGPPAGRHGLRRSGGWSSCHHRPRHPPGAAALVPAPPARLCDCAHLVAVLLLVPVSGRLDHQGVYRAAGQHSHVSERRAVHGRPDFGRVHHGCLLGFDERAPGGLERAPLPVALKRQFGLQEDPWQARNGPFPLTRLAAGRASTPTDKGSPLRRRA
jgi:hypothetical protein